MEIESCFFFCGLYIIGKFFIVEEVVVILVNIVVFECEEDGLCLFFGLLVEVMGCLIEDIYKGNDEGVFVDVEFNCIIMEIFCVVIGVMVCMFIGCDGCVSL